MNLKIVIILEANIIIDVAMQVVDKNHIEISTS